MAKDYGGWDEPTTVTLDEKGFPRRPTRDGVSPRTREEREREARAEAAPTAVDAGELVDQLLLAERVAAGDEVVARIDAALRSQRPEWWRAVRYPMPVLLARLAAMRHNTVEVDRDDWVALGRLAARGAAR